MRSDRPARSPAATGSPSDVTRARHHTGLASAGTRERRGIRAATLLLVLAIGLASGVLVMIAWSSGVLPWSPWPASTPVAVVPESPLPVPSVSEVSLSRARAWSGIGRLRDALTALDAIRPGDSLRPQADDLRADIQRQLLAAARATTPSK